ncbi:MAG TPA: sigma-70 family RNA polymerase sigma factor [Opitutaceae bacterium]
MNSSLEPPEPSLARTLAVVDTVLGQLSRRLPAHVSREDLASAGKVALIESFVRSGGTEAALSHARVRGAMLDELRRLDPLSRRSRSQINAIRQATLELERTTGRVPSPAEVAEAAGLTLEALHQVEALAAAADTCSVHETNEAGEPRHVLVDRNAACPAQSAEAQDVSATLQAALDRLPDNHAHVIRRYYLEDATLDDIASELDLSKERVRQIREAGARKLRGDFMVLALWQSFLNRTHDT